MTLDLPFRRLIRRPQITQIPQIGHWLLLTEYCAVCSAVLCEVFAAFAVNTRKNRKVREVGAKLRKEDAQRAPLFNEQVSLSVGMNFLRAKVAHCAAMARE